MKRSATPLHSGSPTYDGEIVHPSHFTSLIQASAMYCGPQSHRIAKPSATSLPNRPKAWRDALANGLEGRPAFAQLRGVPADHFVEMVIDRAEEPAPAVPLGIEARRIGPPHHVRPIRGDGPVVGRVAIRGPQAARGQQAVRAHPPEHARATDRPAAVGEPSAHLPTAFAMKGARRQHRADFLHELPVAHARLGPSLSRRPQQRCQRGRIDRRTSEPTDRTDHRQRESAPRARTALPAHPVRLFHSSVKPLSARSSPVYNIGGSRRIHISDLSKARSNYQMSSAIKSLDHLFRGMIRARTLDCAGKRLL
jgi:hypothetical protein